MKLLNNILIGFLVSFIGSIPLGYLNLVGYHIYEDLGWNKLVFYLLGIIFVEAFVIYFTLIFAERLSRNKKLLKYISLFSIVFLLALAYFFYAWANSGPETELTDYPDYSPLLLGIVLSAMNFVQLPFWIGWNLYLLNAGLISFKKPFSFFYLAGTLAGTFVGMLLFIVFLNYVMKESGGLSKYLMLYIVPGAFVVLAIFQALKYYKKDILKTSGK